MNALTAAYPRRRHPGAALRAIARAPGVVADALSGRADAARVPDADLTPEEIARYVVASPRANAYLSVEPDLRAFRTGDGLLTWGASRRHAFVAGGVHARGDAARLLTDFRDALAGAGYRKALVFPVAEPERAALREAGFRGLCVGSEAFVDLEGFDLGGKAHADLRQMVNRGTKRYGIEVVEVPRERAAADLAHLYAHWLAARPLEDPMALLIGTPCFDRAAGRRFLAARAGDREAPVAFITLTPGWDGEGYGVDVMAREPGAPAGAMDVLLTGAIRMLQEEGKRVLSLGACPMAERTPIPGPDKPLLRRIFRWLYRSRLGNRLFPFESLARYKDKFDPRWEPVSLSAWPKMNAWTLYVGCRLWGLFGSPPLVRLPGAPAALQRPETQG